MFEKLLSLVPYNPGLIPQLSFYSRRLREETSIRRTGTIFLVLAFMLQFFAVLSPPQPSLASGDNDLVSGGIAPTNGSAATARANGKAACENNSRGYQRILHYYGISCAQFDSADDLWIHTGSENYYSMGHNTSSGVDTPVNDIPGVSDNVYWRKLSTWNQDKWHVLRLRNQNDRVFYVIFDCGNLVSIGIPGSTPLQSGGGGASSGGGGTVTSTPPPVTTTTPPPTSSTPPPTTTTPLCQYNSALPADSPWCAPPPTPPACQYNGNLPASSPDCKPCYKSVSSSDTLACISVHKTASNITAGIRNADNTTAHAGDVITYTLYAQNKGKAVVKDFTFQENLSDVLDYAKVTDLHGGSINSTHDVSWPAEDIAAGDTLTHQISVKVKNPIPQTPASTSDPQHFDLVMTNVYGNAVNIKLPGSPAKKVEVAAASLPNTGPGTTLFIAAAVMVVAGYFYSRASLLARESDIAVKETATV